MCVFPVSGRSRQSLLTILFTQDGELTHTLGHGWWLSAGLGRVQVRAWRGNRTTRDRGRASSDIPDRAAPVRKRRGAGLGLGPHTGRNRLPEARVHSLQERTGHCRRPGAEVTRGLSSVSLGLGGGAGERPFLGAADVDGSRGSRERRPLLVPF